MISRCQLGYESFAEKELRAAGFSLAEGGPGWGRFSGNGDTAAVQKACFPHWTLSAPVEIIGTSVNGLAGGIADFFLNSIREERIEQSWPLIVEAADETEGLGRRASAVEAALRELLKKKLSRVLKLATPETTVRRGAERGLRVWMPGFQRAWVGREWRMGGQKRMADDPLAPSRSYLKVEEAYGLLGAEPGPGQTVVDLGAAPGGWSYSAAKRGAHVKAIDNGPLKGGALNHPLIEHLREDAFRFRPTVEQPCDWLFCDLVEEPHHVLENLITPWIEGGWCRKVVANLKFGRTDPIALLRELHGPHSVLRRCGGTELIRHLFHDREELTIVGQVG